MSEWRNIKQINTLIIHCSATPNGRFVFVDEIDQWHAKRGFIRAEWFRGRQNPSLTAIGYHFIIYTNGAVVTGRHLEETGAHVKGYNLLSIGICMIGTDKFTLAQWRSLRENISGLMRRFPKTVVGGHRDFSPDKDGNGVITPDEFMKTCPGFDVAEWLANDMLPLEAHLLKDE